MHPLLQLADNTASKLAKLCDTTSDPALVRELALIGMGVVTLSEAMEHLLHLLAHVPEDVRKKAAEEAKACDGRAELTQASDAENPERTIAHTLH